MRQLRFISEILESRLLLAAGALDKSFGDAGKLVLPGSGLLLNSWIEQMILQPDGKLLILGPVNNSNHEVDGEVQERIARLNPNGSFDGSFGNDGSIVVEPYDDNSQSAIALAPNGDIVYANANDVSRFLPNGKPDRSFGDNGGVSLPSNQEDYATTVIAATNTKITYALQENDGSGSLTRLNSDGSRAAAFGVDGVLSIAPLIGMQYFAVWQFINLSNGGLLVFGDTGMSQDDEQTAMVKLTATGKLDKSFGNGAGFVLTPGNIDSSNPIFFNGATMRPDGRIIVSLYTRIAQYLSDGAIDASFGNDGVRDHLVPIGSAMYAYADPTLQTDGKILLLTGETTFDNTPLIDQPNAGVIRLNADGSNDESFGYEGFDSYAVKSPDRFELDYDVGGVSLAVNSANQIYFSGIISDMDNESGFLMRIHSDDVPATFASLNSHGTLSVVGNEDSNSISVATYGNTLLAYRDGQFLALKASSVKRLWFDGGDGDDDIENKTALPATMLGDAGNDTIEGGSGDDSIEGGGGNDSLKGMDGNDTIVGGTGSGNELDGGDGNDRIYGGGGGDLLGGDNLDASDGIDTLLPQSGSCNLFGTDLDTVDYSDSTTPIRMTSDGLIHHGQAVDQNYGPFGRLIGTPFNDTIVSGLNDVADNSPPWFLEIDGGAGNDSIIGSDKAESIDGGPGADTIHGMGGNDTIFGGPGRDKFFGDAGDDLIVSRLGSIDDVDGGSGFDRAIVDDGPTLFDHVRDVEKILD